MNIPKTIQPLEFQEAVSLAFEYGLIDSVSDAYCKECGEPLLNGSVLWKNPKQTDNILRCNRFKKTFLYSRVFNDTKYRLCRCDKCIKEKYPEYKGNLCSTSAYYVQYAFGVTDDDFEPMKRKACVRSLAGFIAKYGQETGTEKWNAYCVKQSEVNTFEYKAEKYGWTKEDFESYNKNRAVTLENQIKKYGPEEGKRRFYEYRMRQAYTCSLEYFLESARDYETGMCRYKAFVEARAKSGVNLNHSMIGDMFCEMLDELLSGHECLYGSNEKIVGPYSVDFYDVTANVVVEFNGDYWHRNPVKFSGDSTYTLNGRTYKTSDKWEYDRKRKEFIEDCLGCEVLVVWESDFRKDSKKTVYLVADRIKSFLS